MRSSIRSSSAAANARRNLTFFRPSKAGMISHFSDDVRFALWLIRKSPGLSAIIILTLALAIGANTAVFSVVQAVFLKPLPYPHSDRVVHLWQFWTGGAGNMSYPDYVEMVRQNHSFESIAAYESWGTAALTGTDRTV